MECGPIVIELSTFLTTVPSSPNPYTDVAADMMAKYTCFQESDTFIAKWARPNLVHHNRKPAEKPRIGTRELSKEHIARKDFLAVINKLSQNNILTIMNQCKSILRAEFVPMYVDMIWDAMLRSPEFHVLYAEMLHTIDNSFSVFGDIHRIWDDYIRQEKWLPVVAETDDDYDQFCDQVKSKKRAISSISAWIHLAQRNICNPDVVIDLLRYLLDYIQHAIDKSNYHPKKVETVLEELLEFLKHMHNDQWVLEHIRKHSAQWSEVAKSFPPIIRFKFYDICELVQQKMNT